MSDSFHIKAQPAHAPGVPGAANRQQSAQQQLTNASGFDALRRELLSVRAQMVDLMAQEKIARNGTILYSGFAVSKQEETFREFQFWLHDQGYPDAVYLEITRAGRYLARKTNGLLKQHLAARDWNDRQSFNDGAAHFSVSLMGFWRQLSAEYAKKASGTVHLLVAGDRQMLIDVSQEFWKRRMTPEGILPQQFLAAMEASRNRNDPFQKHGKFEFAQNVEKALEKKAAARRLLADADAGHAEPLQPTTAMICNELKVLGLVELPILLGLVSRNAGVDCIRVYTCAGGGTGKHDFKPMGTIPGEHASGTS